MEPEEGRKFVRERFERQGQKATSAVTIGTGKIEDVRHRERAGECAECWGVHRLTSP